MRETIRAEEAAVREGHRQAFDRMVEQARLNPPMPHDPMRFRAVPPGALLSLSLSLVLRELLFCERNSQPIAVSCLLELLFCELNIHLANCPI